MFVLSFSRIIIKASVICHSAAVTVEFSLCGTIKDDSLFYCNFIEHVLTQSTPYRLSLLKGDLFIHQLCSFIFYLMRFLSSVMKAQIILNSGPNSQRSRVFVFV